MESLIVAKGSDPLAMCWSVRTYKSGHCAKNSAVQPEVNASAEPDLVVSSPGSAAVMLARIRSRPGLLRLPWFCSCSQSRAESTLTRIPASSSAEREAPTPLLFLSAAPDRQSWSRWTSYFSEKGWESVVVELDPQEAKTSGAVLAAYEEDLVQTLRKAPGGMPFPPSLISRGWLGGLVAQTYASSHPLSALLLVDPAITSSRAQKQHPDVLPTELDEPDFEATFPVRIAWSQAEMQAQKEADVPWFEVHRIEHELEEDAEEALDRIIWADADEQGPQEMQAWLEEEVGL